MINFTNINFIEKRKDIRLPQCYKLIKAVIPKTQYDKLIGIILDNTLIMVYDWTLMYEIPLIGVPLEPDIFFIFDKDNEETDTYNYYKESDTLRREVRWRYYNLNTVSNELIGYEDYVNRNEVFINNFSSLKAADGMKFYNLMGKEKYIAIPIFAGFPNLNKGDDLSIYAYQQATSKYVIIKFVIDKKKIKNRYNIIFKTLDLYRSLMITI